MWACPVCHLDNDDRAIVCIHCWAKGINSGRPHRVDIDIHKQVDFSRREGWRVRGQIFFDGDNWIRIQK